ncbi:MAG: cytochrome C [Dyella sp.]
MRTAWLIGLGLVIGILGSVSGITIWRQRTPLPVAVMTVMQHHLSQLQDALKQNRCHAADSARHLQRLSQTATDIDAAFPGADGDFLTHATDLREKLNRAVTSAAVDCATLSQASQSIGQACDACHQQYR